MSQNLGGIRLAADALGVIDTILAMLPPLQPPVIAPFQEKTASATLRLTLPRAH